MEESKGKFVLLALLLVLGVGFAAISVTMYINGTVSIKPDASNFSGNVKFKSVSIDAVSEAAGTVATLSSDGKKIEFTTHVLKEIGEAVTLTYDVTNNSQYNAIIGNMTCTKTVGDDNWSEYINITPTNGLNGTTVITIGDNAFSEKQLTSVTIPVSVTTIGENAFGNNQLTSVIFEDTEENPSKLTSIGKGAFSENQLTNLIIPSSVTYIDNNAFVNNQFIYGNDITIKFNDQNSKTRFDSRWSNIGFPIIDKYGCFYLRHDNNGGITGYDDSCSKDVTIPNIIGGKKMTSIESNAFAYKELTSVTIPSGVTAIGYSAFKGNKLTTLMLSANVTYIGDNAFSENNFDNSNDITIAFNDQNSKTRFDSRWYEIGFPDDKYECFSIQHGNNGVIK